MEKKFKLYFVLLFIVAPFILGSVFTILIMQLLKR